VAITVSIGVAGANEKPDETLVEQADAALYLAKQNGRNRVEVAPPPASPGSVEAA
jgi:diguanylate cyclase (GGDEF)-like protein